MEISALPCRWGWSQWWCTVQTADCLCRHTGIKLKLTHHKMPNIYHTLIPVKEKVLPKEIFVEKEEIIFSNHVWEWSGGGGVNADTPALVRWMSPALTDRSFPAHLHSSLLVGDAGQGICNKDKTVSVYREKSRALSPCLDASRRSCGLRAHVHKGWRGRNVICYPLCFSLVHYSTRCKESI